MTNSGDSPRFVSRYVDHIPVCYVMPVPAVANNQLVIWIPPFSGTKEAMKPYLEELAVVGFTALSFDPWQHGERSTEPSNELWQRVFSNFRQYMWPILGQTALDSLRVIDWAIDNLNVAEQVRIGGISMGGDIAVAAAGIDKRIQTVAAIVSTPDWLRPGMSDFQNPPQIMPPGAPDAYAKYFYNHLNPLTHLDSFAHCPAICFECGEIDTHVPPDGALRFKNALKETYHSHPDRLQVTLHRGLGHTRSVDPMWHNCLDWFRHY